MARSKYSEGDWFAVPLRDTGFALGRIARANRAGVLLGYFFGARYGAPPSAATTEELAPSDAVLVCKFGHLGLKQGRWPLIGAGERWDRSEWPMPVFIRYEELTGKSFEVRYDDHDPGFLIGEQAIAPGSAEQGPPDGLYGAGAVELALTDLIGRFAPTS